MPLFDQSRLLPFERSLDPAPQSCARPPIGQPWCEALDLNAIPKNQIGRHSTRVEGFECIAFLFDVDLYEPHPAREFIRQIFDDRQLPDTAASPICKEVDHHYPLGGRDLGLRGLGREGFESGQCAADEPDGQ